MKDGAIFEVFKWFGFLLGLTCIASFVLYTHQVRETPNFQQYVNYEIERNGGLTEQAVDNITQQAEKHYGGRYTISSPQLNQKVSYGETVEYTIKGVFEIKFIPGFDPIEQEWPGIGQSLIR